MNKGLALLLSLILIIGTPITNLLAESTTLTEESFKMEEGNKYEDVGVSKTVSVDNFEFQIRERINEDETKALLVAMGMDPRDIEKVGFDFLETVATSSQIVTTVAYYQQDENGNVKSIDGDTARNNAEHINSVIDTNLELISNGVVGSAAVFSLPKYATSGITTVVARDYSVRHVFRGTPRPNVSISGSGANATIGIGVGFSRDQYGPVVSINYRP